MMYNDYTVALSPDSFARNKNSGRRRSSSSSAQIEEDFHFVSHGSNQNEHGRRKTLSNLYVSGKCKIIGSLYNIVHQQPAASSFNSSPVFLLGLCYDCTVSGNEKDSNPYPVDFHEDFSSLLWFCYRKDFPPMEPTHHTTDIGWGCMLRTGQMILAQALIRHLLGRDWRLTLHDKEAPYSTYRQILRWFADTPHKVSPFSIHNIVQISGAIDNKYESQTSTINKPGEYFAPTRVCKILQYLLRMNRSDISMYVPKDAVIYKDKVEKLCMIKGGEEEDDSWKPLIIIVPLRLGIDKLNKLYISDIKSIFRIPYTIGIIGGRPKQSLYFVGFQEDQVIYLDPHIVKPASTKIDKEWIDSHHCNIPRTMSFEEMDPSLAIGFYCSDKDDFDGLCTIVSQMASSGHPLFTVEEKSPNYTDSDDEELLNDTVMI